MTRRPPDWLISSVTAGDIQGGRLTYDVTGQGLLVVGRQGRTPGLGADRWGWEGETRGSARPPPPKRAKSFGRGDWGVRQQEVMGSRLPDMYLKSHGERPRQPARS